jgi:hypothetical protein
MTGRLGCRCNFRNENASCANLKTSLIRGSDGHELLSLLQVPEQGSGQSLVDLSGPAVVVVGEERDRIVHSAEQSCGRTQSLGDEGTNIEVSHAARTVVLGVVPLSQMTVSSATPVGGTGQPLPGERLSRLRSPNPPPNEYPYPAPPATLSSRRIPT